MQAEVLESIIEDQQVAAELGDGMASALNAVFVNHDGNAAKVLSQHEGLVTGILGIKQECSTFGDDTNWRWVVPGNPPSCAFVSPAQYGNLSSAQGELASKLFNNRRLSRATDSEIADAYHGTSELVWSHHMGAVEMDS